MTMSDKLPPNTTISQFAFNIFHSELHMREN